MLRFIRAVVVGLVAVLVPAAAAAQGAIAGTVRDTTGAVLPGVTVEAASPVLIEKVRSGVTDDAGQYRIVDLRPGTYTVTFTLSGFTVVKREGIELSAGFTASVNGELKVGSIEETVVVTGASPTVDVQSTTRQYVLGRETIDNLPTSKRYDSLARLIPGMTVPPAGTGASPYDVGGSQGETSLRFSLHGGSADDVILQVDGLRYQQPGEGARASLGGFDSGAQEINFETSGLSAEWATGGVRVNIIPKEGGNNFRGGFYGNWTNSALQSDNFSSELKAQNLAGIDTIERMWDIHPEFGGRIMRDRLWFYSQYRYWGVDKHVADSFYNFSDDPLRYVANPNDQALQVTTQSSANVRLTWQATPKNKVTFYGDNQTRVYDQIGAAGRSPETWHHQVQPIGYLTQAKWTSSLNNQFLLEAGLSYYRVHWINEAQPRVSPNDFSVTDLGTGRVWGAAPTYIEGNWGGPLPRASLSYVSGSHNIKAGFTLTRWWQDQWTVAAYDLNLRVRNGAADSVVQWATPLLSSTNLDADLGIFVQDQWTMRRLTLNLGLRYDYLRGSVPAQNIGPEDIGSMGVSTSTGRFLPYKSFDPVSDVPNLKDISPRFGLSYDLFGNGKTAIKFLYNRYLGALTGTTQPTTYNPMNTLVTNTTRSWVDLDQDKFPDDNELGPPQNTRFGQLVPGTRIDDELREGWSKRLNNWETSVGIQHEIAPNISMDFSYFRRWFGNFDVTDNVLAAPSDYDTYCITAPLDPGLPNGGGYEICDLWDINGTKFGQVDNFRTEADNFGERTENWNGFDLSLNARLPRGTLVSGGLSMGKTTTDNCEIVTKVDNPSQRFCHTETPYLTQFKLIGVYTLPWAVQISGTFQSLPGEQVTARYAATLPEIIPSLGRPLSGGTRTATVELVEPGTTYGDRVNQVDLRLSKRVALRRARIEPEVSIFNLLNASPVVRFNTTYGSEWLRPQGILLGRFVKIGANFTF